MRRVWRHGMNVTWELSRRWLVRRVCGLCKLSLCDPTNTALEGAGGGENRNPPYLFFLIPRWFKKRRRPSMRNFYIQGTNLFSVHVTLALQFFRKTDPSFVLPEVSPFCPPPTPYVIQASWTSSTGNLAHLETWKHHWLFVLKDGMHTYFLGPPKWEEISM